ALKLVKWLCLSKLSCISVVREQEKRQLTIFYGGKVLVFDDFPAEKAKDLMQMASKSSSTAQNCVLLPSSATATVADNTKVSAVPAPASALPVAQANAPKPVRPNAAGNYSNLGCYCLL
ncbi:Os03g0402800, partial [Oryza sativa Japonica Group]